MKTKNFLGVGVTDHKTKETHFILGTDYNQAIVVYGYYFGSYSRDYVKYLYKINDDQLNEILEKVS